MATQPTTPIIVNPDAKVPAAATAARYVLAFLGGIAVSRGILPEGTDVEQTVGVVVDAGLAIAAGASAIWGVWRTVFNKRQLVVAAKAAPDSVAVVQP